MASKKKDQDPKQTGGVVSLQGKRLEKTLAFPEKREQVRAEQYAKLFLDAAGFVRNGAPRSDADRKNAVTVLGTVLGWFVRAVPPDNAMQRLAYLAKLLEPSVRAARVDAVNAIRAMAQFHAEPEAVAELARRLALNDGLQGVTQDVQALANRLAAVDDSARGKKGKISPERLLAELIFDEKDALGFKIDTSADAETEIERIRILLGRDVAKSRKKQTQQA